MVVAQLADHLRLVAPRIDLLHAQHGRDVRNPPGMHVDHWRQWHVHVFNAQTGSSCGGTDRTRHVESVKKTLAGGEGEAFRGSSGDRGGEREMRREGKMISISRESG